MELMGVIMPKWAVMVKALYGHHDMYYHYVTHLVLDNKMDALREAWDIPGSMVVEYHSREWERLVL